MLKTEENPALKLSPNKLECAGEDCIDNPIHILLPESHKHIPSIKEDVYAALPLFYKAIADIAVSSGDLKINSADATVVAQE